MFQTIYAIAVIIARRRDSCVLRGIGCCTLARFPMIHPDTTPEAHPDKKRVICVN